MPWWEIALIVAGAFAAGALFGYCAALLQVGKGMNW